jgi:hypothetical protein
VIVATDEQVDPAVLAWRLQREEGLAVELAACMVQASLFPDCRMPADLYRHAVRLAITRFGHVDGLCSGLSLKRTRELAERWPALRGLCIGG